MRAAAAAWWAWFPLALSAATDAPDLFRAVRDDDRAAVQQLLRQGANPNAREPDGTTPLGWAAVRSEMRGRYPRHPWPEDPTKAEATSRAKPRGT